MHSRQRWVVWSLGTVACAAALSCGIAIHRDLSAVPAGQVGFDDMCGLQEYFDALEIKTVPPPRVVSGVDLEGNNGGKSIRGGRERFAFDNDFVLKHLRRILAENWRRLPPQLENAKTIEVEVRWSEKAGAKRVITDQPAELAVGADSWDLPYHVCLSELLYGEPLYRQRRVMWGLPLPGQPGKKAEAAPDGGAADAPDGGVTQNGRDGGSKAGAKDGGPKDAGVRDAGGKPKPRG
jgi:hypothetical protein